MALSEYFEDSDVVNQLRNFFNEDESWNIDFYVSLGTIKDLDNYYELKIKNRLFNIDKITGDVTEVEI